MLTLGKSFNRCYNLRLPFLDGFYNVGIYFNNRSSFLLFSIDPDFQKSKGLEHSVKINMFKNLESSRFCETFLNLHNYRKSTLDIVNQFESVKPEYYSDINFILNETITLSKYEINDKDVFDVLMLYGFTISNYSNEFIFLLCERQNIIKKVGRKVVRTSGVQIATSPAIGVLNEFYEESKVAGKVMEKYPTDRVIKFNEVDGDQQ